MTTDQFIIDLAAGIPTIIAAITALILAIKGNNTANNTQQAYNAHVRTHVINTMLKKGPIVSPYLDNTPETPAESEPSKVGESGASLMGFASQVPAPQAAVAAPADLGTAETDVLSDVAQDAAPVETAVSDDVPLAKKLIAQLKALVADFEAKHT
jgi:hypothetical protein